MGLEPVTFDVEEFCDLFFPNTVDPRFVDVKPQNLHVNPFKALHSEKDISVNLVIFLSSRLRSI